MNILKRSHLASFQLISVAGIVVTLATPGYAAVYLTLEQAKQAIFPGQSLTELPLNLTDQMKNKINKKADLSGKVFTMKAWRCDNNGFFFVDQVIGKHELITYAVGVDPDGSIRQIEIMEYREAYGFEIRQKRWRRQFSGKTSQSPLSLNDDIKNISGATLSCRHVTEGVKRIMSLYELVLKK